jgi:hypothetical protein
MTARAQPRLPHPGPRTGPAEVAARVAAVAIALVSAAVFVIGTYFWTRVMTDTFSPLGYAFTPVGMYGIAIVLIPVMGVVHRLWISGDLERKEGIAQQAERDRLRTSLLGAPPPGSLRNVHAKPPPENLIFGDDPEELRRRRREGR